MMQLYLIRHGEPDWQQLGAEAQDGRAGSLAPLTALGRLQMDAIAADYRLQEADAIISSSYTRCLESAARLSRQLNKQLFVEHALHEWLPSRTHALRTDRRLLRRAGADLRRELEGGAPAGGRPWESLSEVRDRAVAALTPYAGYGSCIVLTHQVVISALLGSDRPISHAEIVECVLPPPAVSTATAGSAPGGYASRGGPDGKLDS